MASAHGPLDDRLSRLDREIAADPESAELYRERAEVHRLGGDTAAALADLDRATTLGGGHPHTHFFRGRVLLEAGQPAKARVELELFLARVTGPGNGWPDRRAAAHVLLARAALDLDEPARAVDEYLAAIRLDLELAPQIYVDCARVAASTGHHSAALECLDAGLDRLGDSPVLAARAVDQAVANGDVEGALDRLERLALLAPAAGRWLVARGELLLRLERDAEARDAFAAALAEIDRLPPSRRRVPAILALEERARAELDRPANPASRVEQSSEGPRP
jgi:tetratricopeptide (TPR) repeat protein